MYLKSVELQGFKSFADKIYLDFNPGITAIVGPNGSGKSNISDAIRWVMGEQSVKSLRGSRMDDVIFSGTEVRKPHGFAEVSLVIDNSERLFPLDYEEVTVTRRIYRSGEGEYFINRNACRLKDIHELFMDTGLGREGYSIIGQGKIDEILSNKSEDRRRIFEEAAGITKYKYRKVEAERKLERTNENLTRVNDIMTELEGQLEPLKNQSEKAKKYLNLREELKNIEVNAAVASIEKFKEELKTAEENYNAISESVSTLQADTQETEDTITSLYQKIEEYDKETESLRQTKEIETEKAADGSNSISIWLANIEHFKENIERIQQEIQKSERGTQHLDALIDEYKTVLSNLKGEVDSILSKKSELETELAKTNDFFSKGSDEVEELKSQIIDKTSEIASLKSKIANCDILIESFDSERINAEELFKNQKDGYIKIQEENAALKTQLESVFAELEALRKEAEEATKNYNGLSASAQKYNTDKNTALAQLSRDSSRKSVLEDMENEFDGYNRSVKAVMTARSKGALKSCKIYGPLSSLVNTDKKYVTAIETAMASVSQNIVTETEQDAKKAIEYLKQNHLGRATFMPVSTIKTRTLDISLASKLGGYIATAKDLVQYDALYEGVVGNVLGATVVVDNIDNAINMAAKCGHKFRIVTLEGEIMQSGGAMTGGSMGKNAGFLSRKAEIDTLSEQIEVLKKTIEKIEAEQKKNTDFIQTAEKKMKDVQERLSLKNEEYVNLKADVQHSDKYLVEANERKESLLKDINTINTRTKEIKADIEQSNNKIDILNKEIESLKSDSESKQKDTEKIFADVQELQEQILSVTIEENAKQKDIEHQNERLLEVVSQKEEIEAEIFEKRSQIAGFEQKIAKTNSDIDKNRKDLNDLADKAALIDKRIEELSGLRKADDLKIRQLQDDTKETREKLFALGQQKVKAETKKAKLEEDLDGVFAHLWEEYELTYSEAVKLRSEEEINLTEANREIASLKSKIKALGSINIDAIEEYKNVSERFNFLTEQTNDLEKAKGELEDLISEMIEIMKKQFSVQFANISKNFNTVFKELFGGGQATLSLADPDDVLESGVEIEAQPPGKKLQSLSLLSGGEKAFTAIALLFAILKVRPTPFCILDEIEAALDDVNVYRYADYLKKYSKKTQFIVVTHRRGTMEAANILYGVTMQEKGISKLLALNIDEVAE
ncbi:MAG: chromosome segregation protein SMC [Clostridia bacterium]|nr:chromosome segregation protein SMC [Clostridia bacterium]